MKERPILFSAPMVIAILDGSKTQTRRVLKLKNGYAKNGASVGDLINDAGARNDACPFGKIGDRLWVRETFQPYLAEGYDESEFNIPNYKTGLGYEVSYPATDEIVEWVDSDGKVSSACKPSIHMPRWASRINLEITNIRIERLRSISEKDAIAEGFDYPVADGQGFKFNARHNFFFKWKNIYGPESWDCNPWVWVIEFKKV